MAERAGLTLTDLLPTLVGAAKSLARTPISRYHVGALGLGSSGRIFFGVNLEFPGLPLHQSVHAEQFLATNLALHSELRLLSFAVSSTPCGHCRQFFQEIRDAPEIQIRVFAVNDPDQEPRAVISPAEASERSRRFKARFEEACQREDTRAVADAKLREEMRASLERKVSWTRGKFYDAHWVTVGGEMQSPSPTASAASLSPSSVDERGGGEVESVDGGRRRRR